MQKEKVMRKRNDLIVNVLYGDYIKPLADLASLGLISQEEYARILKDCIMLCDEYYRSEFLKDKTAFAKSYNALKTALKATHCDVE